MSSLDDLKAAQFMLGPELYASYIWRERVKANPPPPSKMRVIFKFQAQNVVPFRRSK